MKTGKKRVIVWANISAITIPVGTIKDWDIGDQMKSITQAYSNQRQLNSMTEMHLNVLSENMGSSTPPKAVPAQIKKEEEKVKKGKKNRCQDVANVIGGECGIGK